MTAYAAVSDAHVASFQAVRPRLFGIAYRVLGSAAEADDVVQDAWMRWHGTDRSKVRDAGAFLATATTRLAINVSQSARARHEIHVGEWLAEATDAEADPARRAERADAVERAVIALLEKLTPTERAAYVLREAFDHPYRQIGHVLSVSEENARQLVTRARVRLGGDARRRVTAAERRCFRNAFVAAAQTGDLTALQRRLLADIDDGALLAAA
jgi:RNA polymerase sigma-70 factor (ECF subfamily)